MIEAHRDLGSLHQYGEQNPMIRDIAEQILRETFPNENIQFPSLEDRSIPSFALNSPEYRVRYLFMGIKGMFPNLKSSGESLASMFQSVHSLSSQDRYEALTNAAKKGDLETVQVLLELGISEENRQIALAYAAQEGHLEIIRFFLDSGISEADRGWALKNAAANGQLETIQVLLKSGISEADKNTALALAAAHGHLGTVRFFLASGISEADRETALQNAAANGQLEIIRFFLDSGISEADREIALLAAVDYGTLDLVRLLLKTGSLSAESINRALSLPRHYNPEITRLLKHYLSTQESSSSSQSSIQQQSQDTLNSLLVDVEQNDQTPPPSIREQISSLINQPISEEERQVAMVSFILATIVVAITYYIQSYLTSERP